MNTKVINTVICAVLVLLCGCAKEGVYRPEHKISRVWQTDRHEYLPVSQDMGDTTIYASERHLAEMWTWDGDNLLSIAYYDTTGKHLTTLHFEYAKDGLFAKPQLTRVWDDVTRNFSLYKYDDKGKVLQQIEAYQPDSTLVGYITLTRTGDHVTHIEMVQTLYGKYPVQAAGYTFTADLFWTGENVTQVNYTYVQGDITGVGSDALQYDNKVNPLQGSFAQLVGPVSQGLAGVGRSITTGIGSRLNLAMLSKNNVTSRQAMGVDGDYSFAYDYSGDVPVKRTMMRKYVYETMTETEQTVLEYEYVPEED